MEPSKEPQSNENTVAQNPLRHAHTYEDDVARTMNTTDAKVVQELLSSAREREAAEKEYRARTHQKKWYSLFSVLFLLFAIAAFGYALWHYYTLTVPTEATFSVGVFPSTSPIVATETDIRKTISSLVDDATLTEGKPFLVPLVTDATTLAPLSKEAFFRFIEATPTEPFAHSMDIVRLGIYNSGVVRIPFVILSVPDAQIAAKEFSIAEPTLLQLFHRPLGIDISAHLPQVGKAFESGYLYNLPVRVLPGETGDSPVLLYGFATDHIMVLTTAPEVLKAVYDTIIRQR